MEYSVRVQKKHQVQLNRPADWSDEFTATVDKKDYGLQIRATHPDGTLKTVQINHRVYPVEVVRQADGLPVRVLLKGIPYDLQVERVESTRFRPPSAEKTTSGQVAARLPGLILQTCKKAGDVVKKGETIVMLEAMKMENEIIAPRDGKLLRLEVKTGDLVSKGQQLFEIGD